MLGDFHRVQLHTEGREPVKDIGYVSGPGYFLQKRLGVTFDANQKRYYETFGLRWYMPFLQKRAYISYHVNACAIKANSIQFNVGFCPWKRDW